MDEQEKIILELRNEIKIRDKDITLAATYGKDLLSKNQELSQIIEELRHEKELLEQEKHSLQLDLDVKTKTIDTQNSELELQRLQTDNLSKDLDLSKKEKNTFQRKFENLMKENQHLKKYEDDASSEIHSLKEKIRMQEQLIKTLENKVEKSFCEIDGEEYQKLQAQLNIYIQNNIELQNSLAEVKYELEQTKENEKQLDQQIKILEENVKEKDSELSAYSSEVNKYKEEIDDLHSEIELLKFEQVDTKRRGNSVFAELDDRRTLVEKEYKLLRSKYEHFLKKYDENKKLLDQTRGEVAILRSMVSFESQQIYINKLENQLQNANREIQELINQLEAALKEKTEINYDQIKFSSGNEYGYLRELLKQSQAEKKKLEDEIVVLKRQNLDVNNKLNEINRFWYKTKQDLHSAKMEILKLKEDLSNKKENDIRNFEKDSQKTVEIFNASKPSKITETLNSTFVPGELELGCEGFHVVKPPRKSNKFILQEFNKLDKENKAEDSGNDTSIIAERKKIQSRKHERKTWEENVHDGKKELEITKTATANKEIEKEIAIEKETEYKSYRNRSKVSKKEDFCAQQ